MVMESLRVAFLGPLASFSHQAAVESFGTSVELFPCPSFADAFAAVQRLDTDYAIVPFENSTNGSVVQTLDLLADRDNLYGNVQVYGEYYLTVHHCLLGRTTNNPGDYSSVTKVYTHPQAWSQCDVFLAKHLKGVERQDASSTSKAAELVAKEVTEGSAAIASRFAADHHGLVSLAENIEDRPDNTTRFLILGNVESRCATRAAPDQLRADVQSKEAESAVPRKTLISFLLSQDYSPGTLADALLVFKDHGMNLTSISTRPSRSRPWCYVFFVEGRRNLTENNEAVTKILRDLRPVTECCRDWGTWKDQLARHA